MNEITSAYQRGARHANEFAAANTAALVRREARASSAYLKECEAATGCTPVDESLMHGWHERLQEIIKEIA